MIVIYPEKFKGNQEPEDFLDIRYRDEENWDDPVPINGLFSTVVLVVNHKEGEGNLNYEASFKGGTLHVVNTNIDCNYHSDNLKYIIRIFEQFEETL
jgi:hypothetical protein